MIRNLFIILLSFTFIYDSSSTLSSIINSANLLRNNFNDKEEDILNIFEAIDIFLKKNSNITLSGDLANECFPHILSLFFDSPKEIAKLLLHSGKGLSDKGLEKDCNQHTNRTYILTLYEIKETLFDWLDEKGIFSFLNQTYFYTGFCIPVQCKDWVNVFLSNETNPHFYYTYLNSSESPITNISLINENELNSSTGFICLFSIIMLLLTLQILGFIIHFFRSSIQTIQQSGDNSDIEDSLESLPNEEMAIFTKYSSPILKSKSPMKCKDIINTFSIKFNIINNLFFLFSKKCNYYNQYDLELISLYQIMLMLFIIFNQNISTLQDLPSRDFANDSFYTSFLFCTVIISTYAIDCWVALDGMIMIYKLMSYLKKYVYNQEKTVFANHFFSFYIKSGSKIICCLFLFFFTHFYSEHFINNLSFSEKGLFSYYMEASFKEESLTKAYYYLIPFYFYFDDKRLYEGITMQYIILFINEFYAFTFFLILFYLSIKFKSKIYDIIILVIVFLNVLLTYFSLNLELIHKQKYVNFSIVVESSYIRKYPHLLFNNYFVGIIGGMIIFYFKDTISKKPMCINPNIYLPYNYCYYINTFFYSISPLLKSYLIVLITLLGILISMIYSIWAYVNSLAMPITLILKLVLVYDRIVFTGLFIFLVVLSEMNMKKEGFFKHLANWKLFRLFSRISFCLLCSFDVLIIGFFCLFNFQLKLTYENFWLISVGLFLLCTVFTSLFTIAIELPLRIFIKDMFTKEDSVIEPYLLPLEN